MSEPQHPIRDDQPAGASRGGSPEGAWRGDAGSNDPFQQRAPFPQHDSVAQQGAYGMPGQQGPVVTGAQQGYPQGGFGSPSGGAYPPGQSPWGGLSSWGSRVLARVVDGLVEMASFLLFIPGLVLIATNAGTSGELDPSTGMRSGGTPGNSGMVGLGLVLIGLGYLSIFAIALWNRTFKQGRTGQSIGKKVMGIALVDDRTGRPVGPGMAFVRDLAHCLDGFSLCLGLLWPLWDAKRQTFADKVMSTVVVDAPKR